PAILTVTSAPVPLSAAQLQNQNVQVGQAASFTTAASFGIAPYHYRWQRSAVAGGAITVDVAGAADSPSYSFTPTDTSLNGFQFACTVADSGGGTAFSGAALLTVTNPAAPPPVINTQPSAQTVTAPASAVFTVNASGSQLSYQWLRSQDRGATWAPAPVSGAYGPSYTTPATTPADDGSLFLCVLTNTV